MFERRLILQRGSGTSSSLSLKRRAIVAPIEHEASRPNWRDNFYNLREIHQACKERLALLVLAIWRALRLPMLCLCRRVVLVRLSGLFGLIVLVGHVITFRLTPSMGRRHDRRNMVAPELPRGCHIGGIGEAVKDASDAGHCMVEAPLNHRAGDAKPATLTRRFASTSPYGRGEFTRISAAPPVPPGERARCWATAARDRAVLT
jgi:hypothetical protein